MGIRLNLKINANSTVRCKISDAQIRKHISNPCVRQLKDDRYSLYLRFNAQRTAGTWWLMMYEHGAQIQLRVGRWPTIRSADIPDVISSASAQYKRSNVVSFKRFDTVDQLIEWHVQRQAKLKTSSKERIANIKSMANRHLIGVFHGEPVMGLNSRVIDEELIQPMFDSGMSVSYVKAMFNLLKSAYATARELKHITINPLSEIRFKQFFPENFSITKAQVRECRLATDKLPDVLRDIESIQPNERMLVLMMLAHGSRIGETRKATWRNVSFRAKRWIIPAPDTKTRAEMIYPLSDPMLELLQSYREWQLELGYKGDHLFPIDFRHDRPVHGALASEWVQKVASGWSAHDLRKRARSVWTELGIDYLVGETLLNHAKGKLDLVYIHTYIDLKKIEAISLYHEWLKKCWRTCFRPVSIDQEIIKKAI